jgi:hypothetical protein
MPLQRKQVIDAPRSATIALQPCGVWQLIIPANFEHELVFGLSALLLAETLYLEVLIWHDEITAICGVASALRLPPCTGGSRPPSRMRSLRPTYPLWAMTRPEAQRILSS